MRNFKCVWISYHMDNLFYAARFLEIQDACDFSIRNHAVISIFTRGQRGLYLKILINRKGKNAHRREIPALVLT